MEEQDDRQRGEKKKDSFMWHRLGKHGIWIRVVEIGDTRVPRAQFWPFTPQKPKLFGRRLPYTQKDIKFF
jgi:hypothetical protein